MDRESTRSSNNGSASQSPLEGTEPMSDFNLNALTALQVQLRTKVDMGPQLNDILEIAAGGFMTKPEAQSVRNDMGRLIHILQGKGNKEFDIFCEMLRVSNYSVWADKLKQEAKSNKEELERKLSQSSTSSRGTPAMVLERKLSRSSTSSRGTPAKKRKMVLERKLSRSSTSSGGTPAKKRKMECQAIPERSTSAPPGPSTPPTQSPKKPAQDLPLQPSAMTKMATPTMTGSVTKLLPPMPMQLQVISSVLLENKVYVSGIATDNSSRQVQVYSLDEGKWSTLPEAPNYNAPAIVINDHYTLVGGRESDNETDISDVLSSWNEDDNEWKQLICPMPTKRLASGICLYDDLLLVTGGIVEERGKLVVDHTVDVYNFNTKEWITPKALKLLKALRSHHVVVFEENIYLMGGATTYPAKSEGSEKHFNSLAWRARWSDIKEAIKQPSQPVKNVWTPIAAPPDLRPTVISYRNSLMSVGGVEDGEPKKTIYKFVNGKADNPWIKVGSLRVGRYRHGVVPLGICDTIYLLFVAGGYEEGKSMKDEHNEKSNSVEVVLV